MLRDWTFVKGKIKVLCRLIINHPSNEENFLYNWKFLWMLKILHGSQ